MNLYPRDYKRDYSCIHGEPNIAQKNSVSNVNNTTKEQDRRYEKNS